MYVFVYWSSFFSRIKGGHFLAVASRVVLQKLLQQKLVKRRLGGNGQHFAAKVVDVRHAAVDSGLLFHLGHGLVRVIGRKDAEVLVVREIGAVKAVQPSHLGPGDLIKHAPLAEDPAHTGSQSSVHHLGSAAQHDGHLHLVHVVYADAGGIVGAGKLGQEFGQLGNFQRLLGDDVLLAEGHDLFADINHVVLFDIGLHILAHQVRKVLAGLDKVGVDGAAVILFAVHHEK